MGIIQLDNVFIFSLFLIYIVLWAFKRRLQIKTTGIDPEVLGKNGSPLQIYFGKFVKLLTVFMILLIVAHSMDFQFYSAFSHFPPLDKFSVDLIGFLIGLCGLGICAVAQKTMGDSWRVGIDEKNRTDLITNGIFTYVRNPTYSGLILLLIGTWLIWPTWTMGMFSILFFFFIEIQVRCEEEYLLEGHGDDYRTYLSQTGRYLPGKTLFKRK